MWSFSKLGTFERCKRRFKFIYMDKIRYQTTSVEAFMGTMVHEALDVLYQRVKIGKLLTLKQLEEEYKKKWEEDSKIYDEIKIVNKELSFDDYFSIGIKASRIIMKKI